MAHFDVPLVQGRFGATARRDLWWIQPLFTFLALFGFLIYANVRVFEGAYFRHGPYLSPFYSPLLLESQPGWWPAFLPFSAAMLILWAPAGFRFTCYYYRGAYYKAFWADPPACTVGEPRKSYWGERKFPLIIQNVHRYFLYVALIFLVILGHDAWLAMWFPKAGGGTEFGIGIGTLVLIVNVILLGGYTLGCHSLRHIVGGYLDRLAKAPIRRATYDCVSCLNKRHMLWAWLSLFWVAFSDVYVRLCATGALTDRRLF